MDLELSSTDSRQRSIYALSGAFLLAIMVFLIVPATQWINASNTETIDLREVLIVQPATPVELPLAPEQPPAKEHAPKPKFQQQPAGPNLTQLARSLNPGISHALAIGMASTGFQMEIDTVGDIEKLFTFDDLPEAPRIINYPKIHYPQELIRRGIKEGRVVVLIEIDERGRAEVVNINSSTHPQLIKTAKDVIRQAQFTKPLINGTARQVRGEWPITLRAPR